MSWEPGQPIISKIESRRLENGQLNWTSTTKFPVRDDNGEVMGLIGITREINDLKQTELALEYMATHDLLTGLPNRFLLMDRLQQVLVRSERYGLNFGLLYIDLDKFKQVNDLHGHDIGDALLKSIAQRIVSCIRESDTLGPHWRRSSL